MDVWEPNQKIEAKDGVEEEVREVRTCWVDFLRVSIEIESCARNRSIETSIEYLSSVRFSLCIWKGLE